LKENIHGELYSPLIQKNIRNENEISKTVGKKTNVNKKTKKI
jgi:hypothetical protein